MGALLIEDSNVMREFYKLCVARNSRPEFMLRWIKKWFACGWLISLEYITCSNVLQETLDDEMVLQLDGLVLSPPLGIGTAFAFFQSRGNSSYSRDFLNNNIYQYWAHTALYL